MATLTVRPFPSATFTFPQFVGFFDWATTAATATNLSSTGFKLSGAFAGKHVTADARGTGLKYDDDGILGGTITSLSFAFNGAKQAQIAGAFNGHALRVAIFDDERRDPFAIERLFMSYDWVFNGTNRAEVAPKTLRVGDGASFNLKGDDLIRLFGGNDTFYSGGGNDQIYGGNGNDNLDGGDSGDKLFGNAGNDKLIDTTTGNDTLNGGAGNDILDGGRNADLLIGGAGGDRFQFTVSPVGSFPGVDRIQDFQSIDTIVLAKAVFSKLVRGWLNPEYLSKTGVAADANDRIVYNPATGALYYDPDGDGSASRIQFATLVNKPTLAAHDFLVI
ncbi:MAG TPA: calcium-binding protein [Rhizobiaceae bacterium]|nr:calcium-binding protein [Rhizobiaceae bacterium]